MKKTLFLGLLLFTQLACFSEALNKTITLKNKSDKDVIDYTAEISVDKLSLPLEKYVAIVDGEVVPVEIVMDIKDRTSIIFPVKKIGKGETKRVTIQKGEAERYPKRTYAELSHKIGGEFQGNKYEGEDYTWVKPNYMKVDGDFRDHSYYIKYEGPGWESDKVGFRFYLDQRNAVDVFGKKTPEIVLPAVGVDNFQSYHKMAGWGMDQMRVGNALGIGTIAVWDGEKAVRVENRDSVECYVQEDGKIRSQIMTTFYGWDVTNSKFNLKSLVSIDAGSRASRMELLADAGANNLTTGFIKDKNAELFKSDNKDGDWAYIASFGKQSMYGDLMGLAVFYRKAQLKEITKDTMNHLLVLTPNDGYVEYYFMPTWEYDWEPVVTMTDFQRCIDEVLNRLNNNIEITIN